MEHFNYKKAADVLALSASITDFAYKKHCHEEYAVGVTLRGIQQYHLEGSLLSSTAGGVMLFNREQYHDGSAHGREGIDYIMLYLKSELISEILDGRELRFSEPIVYSRGLAQAVCALSQAVQRGSDEALCSERLLHLVSLISHTPLDQPRRSSTFFVQRSKEMMLGSVEHVLKLEELCREFSMSKYQFIREFKRHTGVSPYQFYLNCKMELAKQSLERSKDIYAAVAEYGFVDLAHLNRHFKRMFGITAHEYCLQLG